jgi:hypothetical protein
MNWMNKVTGILQQYAGADPSASSPDVQAHYDSVAGAVPKDVLAQGLSAAFNSDQTPAFGEMVAKLFQQSSAEHKVGMLKQLLASAGPAAFARVLASKGSSSNLVGKSGEVTPEMAALVTPETVEAIASETHKQNPSIVDSISGFYAQHPTLVKALGATALSIAMAKISKRSA